MKSLERIDSNGALRFERFLPGPPERIWNYLTSPSLLATWLAEGEMELHSGGYVELRCGFRESQRAVGVGSFISGVVTHCQPPESLAYCCTDTTTISNVTFEIEPRGVDVLLLLTHAGLPKSYMQDCRTGWNARLDALEEQLGSPTAVARRAFGNGRVTQCES